MMWVAIAVGGFAGWLSVVVFFVALCSAATRADRRANGRPAPAKAPVIELATLRHVADSRGRAPASRASAFG